MARALSSSTGGVGSLEAVCIGRPLIELRDSIGVGGNDLNRLGGSSRIGDDSFNGGSN